MGRVSVLGCGWFGLPMAASLVKRGHEVTGSVRTNSKLSKLESYGIKPTILDLEADPDFRSLKHFLDCETLIVSIPPSAGGVKSHFEQVKEFLLQVNDNSIKIIYSINTSSIWNSKRT